MGNLFSCCHPRRKEDKSQTSRLLQDSSTQTGFTKEDAYGSTLDGQQHPRSGGSEGSAAVEKQQSETSRGTAHSSSSSSSISNGSQPAEPATSSSLQHQPVGIHGSAAGESTRPASLGDAARASAAARGSALPATTASGHGGSTERGLAGMAPRGHPAGLSLGAGANGPVAGAYRAAGAMPRAHPNDHQQRWQQHQAAAAAGGAHAAAGGAGDLRMGGRGGVQQYGGVGAAARGGGRFGAGAFGAGVGARGFTGKTMPRAVPAAAGTVLAKYEMKEVLGVGSTSKCYRCVSRRSKKQFACKVGWGMGAVGCFCGCVHARFCVVTFGLLGA